MQSDRELLELAAKAAGLRLDKSTRNGGGAENTGFDLVGNAVLDWHNGKTWNPLTDDGDALRLAVKLSIFTTPEFYHYKSLSLFGTPDHDPYAATRRAIVRAAAALASQEGQEARG